jgi:hypothetical protein
MMSVMAMASALVQVAMAIHRTRVKATLQTGTVMLLPFRLLVLWWVVCCVAAVKISSFSCLFVCLCQLRWMTVAHTETERG